MSLRVLSVASEAFPLIKTGGLADVVGALPAALAPHDVAVTTMLPGYPSVMAAIEPTGVPIEAGPGQRLIPARGGGLDLLVLDAPALYERPGGPYLDPTGADWPDNVDRFGTFCRVAAAQARAGRYDVVHAHDWQAGLTAAFLRFAAAPRVPCLMTVHSMAFQGLFPASSFAGLGLRPEAFSTAGLEYYGQVGFLKAGLWFADRISTVSPTYATEILTPAGGLGLDGLLRGRAGQLSGILNGIDTAIWDPATDPALVARYDGDDPAARLANASSLRQIFGLDRSTAPLVTFIGRLTMQKGIDLILDGLPALLGAGAQLAIIGTGDRVLEQRCLDAAARYPGRVGAILAYDERLAHLCYGGSDVIMVPSRFEPCGLVQLCALRYGAVPLVARVGGLADTVIDANPVALDAGAATGVVFSPTEAGSLAAAIRRALNLHADQPAWRMMVGNAMRTNVSWDRSALRYAALLRELAAR